MAALGVPAVVLMSSLLLLLLCPVTLSAKAPCPRSCNCPNTREVHCTFRHLTSAPANLPVDSERINLGYNSLRSVAASDFRDLLKLEMLMLHGNDIKVVLPGAFHNLHHLQILKLSYNKLQAVRRGMLGGMRSLLRLHLDHNLIEVIEPLSFSGLPSLRLLQLDGNQLRDLHPHTFVTLAFLGHFWGSGLHHLHISDNHLKYLLPGVLEPLDKLEGLSVHGNPWTCDCNLGWLLEWNNKHEGVIKCKKDSGDGVNCATCVSPQLLNNSQVFQLQSEQLNCKRPSIASPLKSSEMNQWEDTEPDHPYIKDLQPPLGHLTFALSDSHGNAAHVACQMSQPSESTSVTWDTLRTAEVTVNVTLMSLLECDIDRDELHNMWRLIAYYYESPAILDRGAKHENTSKVSFQYSQAVNEDSSYFTDLKGHIMAEPSWLLQPRITLQLNRRKTTTKKLVLNFGTFISSHTASCEQVTSSWAVMQRGVATQVQSVIQGSDVTFECNAHISGELQVQWMLPDLTLLEHSGSENIITEDKKLHINNVSVSDSGLYHCLAKTDMEVDAVPFRLAVRERWLSPSSLNGKRISLESGSVLTLDCSVSSPYPSKTTWYLPNSKTVTTSQSTGRVSMLQNNTLVIDHVRHEDAGAYSCLALNLYGVNMLSHLVVVTGEPIEEEEQVSINENEISTENEGSGYEVAESPFPKQERQTFKGRRKHSSRKVKLEKVPSNTPTAGASQTHVTHVTTPTIAAGMDNTQPEKQNQSNELTPTEAMKTIKHDLGHSDSSANNVSVTLQSTSEQTETEPKIKLRNRFSLNSHLTHLRKPPPLRRRRPVLPRPHPNRHNPNLNKDTMTETSINKSWSKIKNRDHTTSAPTDIKINRKNQFRNRDINSPATANQSNNEHTKAATHTTEPVKVSNETLVSKNEYNIYSGRKNVMHSKTDHVNSKNINIKKNDHRQNALMITSTTSSPRKHETTINIPLSATTLNFVGITPQPTVTKPVLCQRVTKLEGSVLKGKNDKIVCLTTSNIKHHDITRYVTSTPETLRSQPWIQRHDFWERNPLVPTQKPHTLVPPSGHPWYFPSNASKNFQQWNSFVTSHPEITSLRPTTSIHPTANGRNIAPHPTHHPTSRAQHPSGSHHRQSLLNSSKFGGLVTPKSPTIKTPRPEQAISYSLTPPPTPVASDSPDSTAVVVSGGRWHYRLLRPKTLSTAVPFPNLMAGALKPKFTSMNAVVSALPETDVSLPCLATGSPKPVISWRRTSTGTTIQAGVKHQGNPRFEVLRNGSFVIRNLQAEDKGQYLCLAQNRFGSATHVVTLVVITQSPKIVNPPSKDFSVYLGKPVNLHCMALGKPKAQISWVLPDRTILREVGTTAVASLSANGTLSIPSVDFSSEGFYKCIARNIAGEDTVTYNINVVATLPTISEDAIESLAVPIGTSLYAHCTATGKPQPDIKWSLPDGTSLKRTQMHKRHFFVFPNGTLHIRSASVTDGGRYECTATNALGSVKRLLLLDTRMDSYLQKHQEQRYYNVSAMYGSTVYLHCAHHGTVWRLPSKTLLAHNYSPEEFVTAFPNGTLRIQHVTDKLAGAYVCTSQRPGDEDMQRFHVEVFAKPPKIENTRIPQISISYGETLQLDCVSSGVPHPDVSWTLPEGFIINSPLQPGDSKSHSDHYVMFDNGTLLLKQINKNDEGDYLCSAKNALGEDMMTVSVQVVAESPIIMSKNQVSVLAQLGSPAHIKCKSHRNPLSSVMWLSPSNHVISPTSVHHQILKDGTLVIKKVTLRDEGRYTCLARNSAITSIELRVERREPDINGQRGESSRNVLAVSYQTTLMDCKSEGKPEAHITWTTSSGLSLPKPHVGGRFQVHKNGSLELRGVRKSDEGQFKCVAKNDLGEARLIVTLKVETLAEKPSFPNPNIEMYPIKSDGSDITLECIAAGKPRPVFVWILPNNTQMAPGTKLHRFTHFIGSGILHIIDPATTDKGIYRCLAKNVAGQAEKRYELQTGKKPYIRGSGGPVKITFGRTLSLPCTAEGWPDASVSWTLPNGLSLVRPQVVGRVTFLPNNTLQVKDTATFDKGIYTCKATNTYGSSFLSYPVTVMVYPPQITASLPSVTQVRRGTSVSLGCTAVGIPMPDISWTLPGRTTLVPSSRVIAQGGIHMTAEGSLVIQDPGLMDSGIYKCNAKNVLGTDFKATYLQVV